MSLIFRKIERKNMKDPEGPKLWYPVLRTITVVTEKELAKLLADETTLNPKEAEMAIFQLQKVLLRVMLDAKSIQLGELGNLYLTLHTEGSETKEEVTSDKIKKVNIRFRPSASVREALQKAHFIFIETLNE